VGAPNLRRLRLQTRRRGGTTVGHVFAVLAPGQGAQRPGQLTCWLDGAADLGFLDGLSAAAGLDLAKLGTTATAEQLLDTAVAQPLVVATSLLAARRLGPVPGVLAGHSVGEWAAAALAGVLTAEEAVALVAVRGRAMAAACAVQPTGMAAVLGGDRGAVLGRLADLDLAAANDNGPGQLVAAGRVEALDALAANPPTGARVRRLAVAGAFHTAHMAPARAALAAASRDVLPRDPGVPLVSNADGALVSDGAEVLARLVAQVDAPVRWDRCQLTLARLGVDAVLELPPAGTLAGLARRALPGAIVTAVSDPSDLLTAA